MAKSLGAGTKGDLPGRRNSLIAGISVAISVVIMIVAISVSDGFGKEIRGKVSGFAGDISVKVPGEELTNSVYPLTIDNPKLKLIKELNGISAVQGVAYITGVMKHNDQIEGIMLKGVDTSYDWSFIQNHLVKKVKGDTLFLPDLNNLSADRIVISSRLASKLGLSVGDRPYLYFIGESVKTRRYTIEAIFDARLEEIDKGLVLCNIDNVRDILNWGSEEYSSLELLVNRGVKPKSRISAVEEILIDREGSQFVDMEVLTPDVLFPHLFDWLSLLDLNVLIVLTLMMVVAGFNMISGLLIILFEKISMIGLLKSLGMRDASIHKLFLIRALTIVAKGILAGNIIALALLYLQIRFKLIPLDPVNYFVDHIPVHINFLKILSLDIISLIVIAAILYIPARFISGVEPDKSLRQQ